MESKNNFSQGKISSGKNLPYWLDNFEPLKYHQLKENISVDAAIIGAGITGITTAYLLSKEGLKVALIDDGFILSGETGRTTAHLVNILDHRYSELEKLFGIEKTILAADSHTSAIKFIESIVKDENINCDFNRVTGYLFLNEEDDETNLKEECEAALRTGINVEIVNNVPGIQNVNHSGLKFPNQAQIHPVKYLKALCDAILKNDGKIFTETKAEDVSSTGVKIKENIFINASQIIVATNTPFINRFVMHTKQAPYRSYVIGAKIKKSSIEKALWWDTGDPKSKWSAHPYHYARLNEYDHENYLLICGGEDHKTGQADVEKISEADRYKILESWTRKHFPEAEEIIYHWSGQVTEPIDALAFIGKNPLDSDNIYIATGYSGNGMTYGTIAGILITDLIMGRKNKWENLYDPSRKTIKALDVFLKDQASVIEQYSDFLKEDKQNSFIDLEPETGMIINKNNTKFAVYRDAEGKLHAFSAICPHLKCILKWNNSERTYDCPCHGSRFTCLGKLINGPANSDLKEIQIQ